jgi:hypothetical protein
MERSEILTAMGGLKLFGMKAAHDAVVATAVKRQHEPQRIIGDLLTAELSEKQARSMKYQLTIAKLPFAKEIDEFVFADTMVNETLVRDLAGGGFLRHRARLHPRRRSWPLLQRRRSRQQARRRGPRRYQSRLADHLCRLDFVILDERGYLPFAQTVAHLLFHLISRL